MQNKASLFVIAAPSGAGKTTLVKAMMDHHPKLRFSVSYTSRKQRKNEVPGKDYFFVEPAEFLQLQADGKLLESALVFDNYYGTSRSQVEDHLANGNNVIVEIDWQGAQQVRQSMPECISIFILPPSLAELARRLRTRRTDSDEVIARRLRDALGDMSHWHEFDFCIINDDREVAIAELEAVFAGTNEKNRSDDPVLQTNIQRILAQP